MTSEELSPARQQLESQHGGMTRDSMLQEIQELLSIGRITDQVASLMRMLLETAEMQREEAQSLFLNPFNVQAIRNAGLRP